jgi:uncharacterized protein
MKLTKAQARRYLLVHQRLAPPRAVSGKAAALEFIRKVGCIQFDPLDMVGCNPNLVLQSRIGGYTQELLNELLYKDRLLVDGFDKQLSIWPVEDWPAFNRNHRDGSIWYGSYQNNFADTVAHVRSEIGTKGPLCSADFEAREKVDWPWGPTNAVRAALESMYYLGELVVHHKARARKYYDLAERHIPREILTAPDPHPDDSQYLRWRVHRRIGSVGLLWERASDAWLGISGMKTAQRTEAFTALAASGDLSGLEVEGIAYPFFIRSQDLPDLELSLQDEESAPKMAFIAPLDNLIWDRKLIVALFGFDYKWEVYTPQAQRKYGYYVLPVLYGDRFIARIEPRLNKKTKVLELTNWWWEDGLKPDAAMKKAFKECLKAFMGYLGAKDVVYSEDYKGLRG